MPGPLSHLTVIELAGIGPAPFACMLLRDMGARVIRIDRAPAPSRGGLDDLMRNDGVVDRGRESISLNMKDARAVDIAMRWIEQADILVEGFRPGVAERLGVGPSACHARNPRLVYGRMTGWGQFGPLASAAGHDINYVALTGALHAMGPSHQPLPPLNLVGDYGGGGMLLALGVLAAQAQAQRTGQGQVVDAAMTDGAALLMSVQYGLLARGAWQDRRQSNFLDGAAHFYGTYACQDGLHVSIGAIEPQFYKQLLVLCEIDDPHFERQWEQQEWEALKTKLAAVFRTKTRAEWCDVLEGSEACFAPVLSMREAPAHHHNRARSTFVAVDGVVQPAPAPRFDRTPSETPPSAPCVGQHTRQLLSELGCSAGEIEHMLAEEIAYTALPA
jgi:alpha-methylacyl-CoA racemase